MRCEEMDPLAGNIGNQPVLILATYRREFPLRLIFRTIQAKKMAQKV
jgi:hypothetical protein